MKLGIAILLAGMLILPADSFARKERDAGLSRSTSVDVRKVHDRVRSLALADESPYADLPALSTEYEWGGSWELTARTVVTRNAQDRVIEVHYETWDVVGQAFLPTLKSELTYSTHPGPDAIITSNYNLGNWELVGQTLYTYNAQEYVIEDLFQIYIPELASSGNGGVWVNSNRNTFTRGAQGQFFTEVYSTWNFLTSAWQDAQRTTNTYSGTLVSESLIELAFGTSWELHERSFFTYSGNLETEELVQRWTASPTASAVWQDAYRYRSVYANGLRTSYTEEDFNGIAWVNASRTLYTNDVLNQRPTEIISQDWLSGQWTNMTRFVLEYDTPTGVGDDGRSILPDGVALNQNSPNPFNPATTISFTLPRRATISLGVFDLLGRKVTDLFKGELPAGEHPFTWDGRTSEGSPVATGMYFYRLQTESGSLTRRMVLVK